MRITIMGAGAMGGYFGARLAAAGNDVTLIARGAHLAAIRADGLRVQSPKGDLHLPDIRATDDPATVGVVDVVMFMVKNYDVDAAARAIVPMLGPETMVVTCQNGVSAPDRLAAVIGADKVVPGVARFPGDIAAPGLIRHSADSDRMSFGEVDGRVSARVLAFQQALTLAGITAIIPDNIIQDMWIKFIGQSALSAITTLTRLDIGPLRDTPASYQLFLDAIAEADRVGRAVVPGLPDGIAERVWGVLNSFAPTMHASMLDDLLRGKPLEVDYLSGEVVRLGRKLGIATPIHSVFLAALSPFADGAPGQATA
jgi:2-dehydropantoate 2-reductase